jgi:hypothetical protein
VLDTETAQLCAYGKRLKRSKCFMTKVMYQRTFGYGSDLVDYYVKQMYTRLGLAKLMVLLNFM